MSSLSDLFPFPAKVYPPLLSRACRRGVPSLSAGKATEFRGVIVDVEEDIDSDVVATSSEVDDEDVDGSSLSSSISDLSQSSL